MSVHSSSASRGGTLLGLAWLLVLLLCGGRTRAQEWWPTADSADSLAGTTRKREPGARACLVFYHGLKNATEERVKEMGARPPSPGWKSSSG